MAGDSVSVAITANTAGFTAGMSKVSQSAKSAAAGVKASSAAIDTAIQKNTSSALSAVQAEKIRARTRVSALAQEIRSQEQAALAVQKYGRATAAIRGHSQELNTLSNGLLGVGITAGIGVGAAVKSFAQFDQAMSNVAATGSDARDNLTALRDAAIDAGAKTAFSATEAAEGIEALAKAGVSSKDALGGGLKGALDLAAAGTLAVGDAAEISASAMNQFGLSGRDVPHIADLLAQAAGTAQGEVSDMASALAQSGLVANQFGLSIEDSTQALALFAKNGLVGSDAGTAFKTMLTSLYAPAGAGAKALKELGISAYDSSGAIKDIGPLADELKNTLDGLSEGDRNKALRDIFGADAIRAGTILLKDGSRGLSDMATEFGKFGSAADVARTKMNNLNGDIEQLKGSLETAFIGAGSGGNDFLRSLAQSATAAVNAFNDLSPAAQGNALKIVAVVGATALAAGGLAKLAIAAAETRAALLALGIAGPRAAAGMAAVGTAGLAAATGLLAVAAGMEVFNRLGTQTKGVDELEASLTRIAQGQGDLNAAFSGANWADELVGSLTTGITPAKDLQSALAGLAVAQDTTVGKFSLWREKITPGTQSFEKAQQQVTALDGALSSMVSKGNGDQAAAALAKLGISSEQVARFFPQYASALESSKGAAGAAADGSEKAGTAVAAAGVKAAKAAADIKAATDAMYAQANAALAMSGNAIAVEAAMDAAAAAAKENGKNLDISTEKGRANQTALDQLASSTLTATQAMVDQGRSASSIVAVNERAKNSYIKTAHAMGLTVGEATELASSLFKIPKSIRSQVVVAGGKVSKKEAQDLNAALKGIPKEQRARIVTIANTKGAKEAQREIAKVKSKEVIAKATGKGVNTVREIDGAIKKLKSKQVQAQAKTAGKPAVDALDRAIKDLKDRRVKASASASGEGAVRRLVGAVGALHNKTITVTTHYRTTGSSKQAHNSGQGGGSPKGATGGLFTGSRFRYSDGGPVWGAGTATSDSIPALLSNGEFVVKAASVQMLGLDRLLHMNATGTMPGFAAGGVVGYAVGGITGPIPRGVDIARIYAMIVAVTRPLQAVINANTALSKAASVRAREDRETAASRAAYLRAVAADKRADAAAKRGGTTKGERARAKATEAAKDKAEAKYKAQLDQQKTAVEKLRDATNALRDAQLAVAESARQMSATLSDPYRSKSNDVDDWLESMRTGAVDLKAFQGQIAQLRKLGVSETLVQQISEKGAIAGAEVAQQIIAGGKALTNALNLANGNLQKSADALGYDVIKATGRYAAGGFVSGAGSATSDSISARLSNGEYVVNARATALNRSVLDAMNYGRSSQQSFLPAYAHGGYVHNSRKEVRGGDMNVENVWVVDPDDFLRKGRRSLQDSLNAASLRI